MNRSAALALLLLASCAGQSPEGEAALSIIGGSPTTGDPAVVMLVSYPSDHSTFDACTASVIAPKVLLTAAHCLDAANHPGYTFGVFTGPDASAYTTANVLVPQLTTTASAVHVHPEYDPATPFHADLGVVVLNDALDVTPLPVNRSPLHADVEGATARIVGYGETVYGTYDAQKHQATTVVASIGADDTIGVGDGTHRSCVGDSGGPALVKMDGVETIVGVDSYTDLQGCLEPANYRRPDLYADFIDTFAPAPPDPGAGTGTGGNHGGGAGPESAGGGCTLATDPPGAPGVGMGLVAVLLALAARRRKALGVRGADAGTVRPRE